MKTIPPFAKQLRERTEIPFREVLLYAGPVAWEQAKAVLPRRAALVYPHDKGLSPAEYYWSCVRGCEVTILHSGGVSEGVLDDLADELVRAGALRVTVVSPRAHGWIRTVGPEVRA